VKKKIDHFIPQVCPFETTQTLKSTWRNFSLVLILAENMPNIN
jgi:hypothetical protein